MKYSRLTLPAGLILWVIWAFALIVPAAASDTAVTTLNGDLPLIISEVQVSLIGTSSATVTWSTNGNSTSQVFYDTLSHADPAEYAFHSSLDSTPVMTHSLILEGLLPVVTYYCRVESTLDFDPLLTTFSSEFSFRTSGAVIQGTTFSANGAALSGVTLTLDAVTSVISAADSTYQLGVGATGTHIIVATLAGYRPETHAVEVTDIDGNYVLDFKGDFGLVPNAPNISYVLACINKWQYPPTDGTALGMSKVLSVVNAWQYPID